jgi:hypothetical protein
MGYCTAVLTAPNRHYSSLISLASWSVKSLAASFTPVILIDLDSLSNILPIRKLIVVPDARSSRRISPVHYVVILGLGLPNYSALSYLTRPSIRLNDVTILTYDDQFPFSQVLE